MAIGLSELGHGDEQDIYPGLYIQATLDELLDLANQDVEGILLSSHAAEDRGLAARVGIDVIDERWMALGGISGKHLDLLERQLQNLRRIVTSPDYDTPQGLLPSEPSVSDNLQPSHPLVALWQLAATTPAFSTKMFELRPLEIAVVPAGRDLQRIALGGHTKTDNKLFSGGGSGCGNTNELVTLAPCQFGQVGQRKDQHTPLAGRHDNEGVLRPRRNRGWR